MAFGAEEAEGTVTVHRSTIEQAQHATHLVVQLLRGVTALTDGLLVGSSQVVGVVGIGLAHRQTVRPRAKLKVETVADGLVGVVTAAPVADNHPVEAPVVLQYLVEHRGVMAVVLVLIQVVGTHDGPRPTLLHGSTEGGQVDFVEGAVAHLDVHLVAILLIVVQGVVLHTGGHTLRLQTLHVGHHHARGKVGILTQILEVAPAERRAVDVHTRAQHHVLVAVQSLLAQALAVEAGQFGVPGGSQTGQCGECHTRVVGLSGLLPLVPEHVGAHTVGAVVRPQIGEAQPLHTRRRELRLRVYHSYLLVQRHALQGVIDALLQRLALVEIDGHSLGL